MKIYFIIANLAAGGAERVLVELANNWVKKNNYEINIVLLTDNEIFYDLNKNINVIYFNLKKKQNVLKKIFSLLVILVEFRQLIKKNKPDFVLSFMNKYNIFTLISLFKLKIKIIVSERDSPLEILPKTTVYLRNRLYKYANGIIAQTNIAKDFLLDQTNNPNIVVIPNPVMKTKNANHEQRQKIILNVGRLVPKKGQHFLLTAFSRLKNRKDWKLVFAGDGPLRKDLVLQSIKMGINDSTEFLGTVKNVEKLYRSSSIFAFTSILEGFPNALAEAMVHGMAVISFDCSTGPADIIEHENNGLLVNEGDVDQFVLYLQELIEKPNRREFLSQNATKLIQKLNTNLICNRYLEFCKNVK